MSKTITSGGVTFMDLTDSRKLDAYITSNLPIAQIFDQNTKTYNPDWNTTNLQLSADIYLDAKAVTSNTYTSITWYKKVGTQAKTRVGTGARLTVNSNQLTGNVGIITYICEATYNDTTTNPPAAHAEITFTRVDTGLNGSDGTDGTSVNILGSYDTLAQLQAAHPTGNAGDAYIVDGNLYVWAVDDAQWENVGNIQGPAGANGRDAKSIILTGDSQVFKVSKTNVVTPSTIKVTAYAFNTTVTNWTYSTNGGQTFLSTVPTGVSRNGNIVTITGSIITSNSIVIKSSDGEVEDVFTIYKAIDGSDGSNGNDGAPAPIAFLTNENVTFSANAQGQISNTTITSNVVAYNGTTKVTPTIGTITGAPTGMTITPSTITASNEVMLTITIANNATLGSTMGVISIPVTYPVSTILYLTWSKVNAGANGSAGAAGSDAYTVILTNESNTFVGDVSNAIAGSTATQVLAYKGTTAQTVTITSVNGKAAATTDTDTGIAGLKFRCSALSGTSPTITFTCTTAFVSANGSIPIVLSVGGISFTKMFSYSIAFKGAPGASGSPGTPGTPSTSYWLVSSANVVQKTSAGTITVTPSTLTFTGKSQTGAGTPIDYACRWVIDVSTDGSTYTNISTSAANETSKTITVLTTYKTIRARMYMAGGTTTLLDEQIIPIVVDGNPATLVDIVPSAYYFKSTTGKDGIFTPEYIYLYPRFQNVVYSNWQYSIDGGLNWINATGVNGLSIAAHNSVANSLRISRASTLYTDTVTSISFRCNSTTSGVYDTVSIAKIYDVVDLQIGGRNLLTNSGYMKDTSGWTVYTPTYPVNDIKIEPNDVYGSVLTATGTHASSRMKVGKYIPYLQKTNRTLTFSMVYQASESASSVSVGGKYSEYDDSREYGSFNGSNIKRLDLGNGFTYMEATFNLTYTEATRSFFVYIYTGVQTVKIVYCKLEEGQKATDWVPATEDVNTNIEKVNTKLLGVESEMKVSNDNITSRVSATEETVKTINNNVTSLSTRVSTAEQKITDSAIVSTVRQSTDYINDLGKKVGNTEIISKINQTAETITISANKIGLLGATNIPDLTADKIKGGTLTLGGSSATTQNGQLLVKNASNTDVLKVNKDGIVVKSGHLAVAKDFANQTYNWESGTWTTTTNTSQLDLSDDYIRMGIYSPSGYAPYMILSDTGLTFQGNAQGVGSWGSFIGHEWDQLDFVIQDTVRSRISFRGAGDIEMANLNSSNFDIKIPTVFNGGISYVSIPANSNLNNYRTPGFYKCPMSATAATLTNCPTVSAFSLTVEEHAGVKQTLTVYLTGNQPIIYVRNFYNNTWGQWSRLCYAAENITLWSGVAGVNTTLTLKENFRDFRYLTCIIGTTTEPFGIVLGSFLDAEVAELHFSASFTATSGRAGNNTYGAKFTVSSGTSIRLVGCGTIELANLSVRKIVGWR